MTKEYIIKEATLLTERFDTRDPEQIAEGLDICVARSDIGTLKGLYTVLLGQPYIVVSEELDPLQSRQIIAHELGHHQLHQHFAADNILQETMLYNMTLQPEYEANLFAAHLLIGDEAKELATEGATLTDIAVQLCVEERLVEIYFGKR